MARIRTIKPQFFKDGDLFDAEEQTKLPLRVAFVGLWTIADREGRFKWKPKDIKPDVLPFDNVSMAEVLDALVACGKIQRYTAEGQEIGWVPGFKAHQHINQRETASDLPAPPQNKTARAKRVRAPDESVGKGKEGKGKEGDADFEEFWKAFPKRENRTDAIQAFSKALEKTTAQVLIAGARAYASKRIGEEKKFTKQPATWLNKECWMDDGIAPAEVATADEVESASRAWGGQAAPLVAEIGAAAFHAYFAGALFEAGPPAHIRGLKPHVRNIIARKFPAQLERAFGEYDLEAA